MAKTYNTIPTTTTGSVYTAAAHNNIVTNVNNYRVPPMCVARRAAAQTLGTSGSIFAINLDTQDVDTDDMFAPTSNTITIGTTGVYQLSMSVCFSANTTGVRGVFIYLNPTFNGSGDSATINTGTRLVGAVQSATSAIQATVGGSMAWSLTAGNTLALAAYQTSGGSLSTNASGSFEYTYISVAWIGQAS